MENDNPKIQFEQLPDAVAELIKKVDGLSKQLEVLSEKIVPGRPDILSLEQCADFLGKTQSTIYTMCSRGRIPYHKGGNKLYFFMNELVDWMKSATLHKSTKKPAESAPSETDTDVDLNAAPQSDDQSQPAIPTEEPVKTDANPRLLLSSLYFDVWHDDSLDVSPSQAYIKMKQIVQKERYADFLRVVNDHHGSRNYERKIYQFNSDDDALACAEAISVFMSSIPSNS